MNSLSSHVSNTINCCPLRCKLRVAEGSLQAAVREIAEFAVQSGHSGRCSVAGANPRRGLGPPDAISLNALLVEAYLGIGTPAFTGGRCERPMRGPRASVAASLRFLRGLLSCPGRLRDFLMIKRVQEKDSQSRRRRTIGEKATPARRLLPIATDLFAAVELVPPRVFHGPHE